MKLGRKKIASAALLVCALFCQNSQASPQAIYKSIQSDRLQQHYLEAARTAFKLSQDVPDERVKAFAHVFSNLFDGGFPQASSYFFVEALKARNPEAQKIVLPYLEALVDALGADFLRDVVTDLVQPKDVPEESKSAYFFLRAKSDLMQARYTAVVDSINFLKPQSRLFVYGLQLRGTALSLLGRLDMALRDFQDCEKYAVSSLKPDLARAIDLQSRCQASAARVLYQLGKTKDADRVYDSIQKERLVWPETLIEQAWNAFAQGDFNRTLGKLVSYESPYLKFILNGEVALLRAMAFLGLCKSEDANQVVSEFTKEYESTGARVKAFLSAKPVVLSRFFELGEKALADRERSTDPVAKFAARFVKSPYFQDVLAQVSALPQEKSRIETEMKALAQAGSKGRQSTSTGLAGFLGNVYAWRKDLLVDYGGAFIQNSLLDHYGSLVNAFEQMAFVKIEALDKAKQKLLASGPSEGGVSKAEIPKPKSYQFFWKFNGEFWGDELGDYVFAYVSECGK